MAIKQSPDTREKDQPERPVPSRSRPLPQRSSPLLNVGLELVRDSHC